MISPGLNSCENSLNTLRYADRVKELGASDPAMASSGRGPLNDYEEEMMDNEDDLAQLRSLNVRVLFFCDRCKIARCSRGPFTSYSSE
jgi:kinesin family protein 2/24